MTRETLVTLIVLSVSSLGLACALSYLAIQGKRWAVALWSELLDGCARDIYY